ncbi:MAG: sensor histidine kinase [Candidatus Cyclobacteriaceae bacterium M3_2C_046]
MNNSQKLAIIAIITGFMQLVIITYNHLSGFYINQTFLQFLFRWIFASGLSYVFVLIILYLDLKLIHNLNEIFAWPDKPVLRTGIQFLATVGLAVIISFIPTYISHQISPYPRGLSLSIIDNALITSVVNLILMIGLEAWLFFVEERRATLKAKELEKELTQIKYEVLKNQVNPHFLFNSLNVLSSLISKDVNKAQLFIEEFSLLYRYVLETIDKKAVPLKDEIEFNRSYIYLQKIRYGQGLELEQQVESQWLDYLIPPLSFQVVMENAIKHNVISADQPLIIRVEVQQDWVFIKNHLRQKMNGHPSTGLGQKNLARRYAMICDRAPVFKIDNQMYLVKLPLIKPE